MSRAKDMDREKSRVRHSQGAIAGNPIRGERAVFLGFDPDGFVELLMAGEKMLGVGKLFLELSMKVVNGKKKVERVLEHTTIKYHPDPETDSRIRCKCAESGLYYRFVGVVAPANGKPVAASPRSEPVVLADTLKVVLPPQIKHTDDRATSINDGLVDADAPKKITPVVDALDASTIGDLGTTGEIVDPSGSGKKKRKRAAADMVTELTQLATMRDAGFDPEVRLRIFSVLAKESRASLYRKILLGTCPPPKKRGKGSFWPLSHVDAYIAGTWSTPAAAGLKLPAPGKSGGAK